MLLNKPRATDARRASRRRHFRLVVPLKEFRVSAGFEASRASPLVWQGQYADDFVVPVVSINGRLMSA